MSTPKPPSGFRTDIPRRVVDIPSPRRPDDAPAPERSESARRLMVGREITLSGEISSCDHLVVEGRIEARIADCQTIEVLAPGVFKGSAEIGDADIAGRFEGDLIVTGRLRLRGQGMITGTVKYGELEVETGGRLIGQMEPLEAGARSASSRRQEPQRGRGSRAEGNEQPVMSALESDV